MSISTITTTTSHHPSAPSSRWQFTDDTDVTSLLHLLRQRTGLRPDGPPTDIKLWRESGPNNAPVWLDLHLDWNAASLGKLDVAHGDTVVVQEHPTRLPADIRHPRTAPELLKKQARRK